HRGRQGDRVLCRRPPRRPEPLRDRALPAFRAGRGGPAFRARRDVIELGLIGSAWHGTGLTVVEGIRKTKELGFDSYDVFEDPLMISPVEQQAIKDTCAEVGLPVRSAVCIALGLVDFVPAV